MTINVPRMATPNASLSAVSAAARARAVLGDVALAHRRSQMLAAVHEIDGCDRPGECRPCRWEAQRQWQERDEADRRRAIAQHAISVQRVVRALRLDQRRIARSQAIMPGARCQVCSTAGDGSKSCRSCGAVQADPAVLAEALRQTLDAANGTRPGSPEGPLAERRRRSGGGGATENYLGARRTALSARSYNEALRSLDPTRCRGCGERGHRGRFCESCSEGS